MEISQRPRQRLRGECKDRGSPFHFKKYHVREQGDENNGTWTKYLNLLDAHRGQRTVCKKPNLGMEAFGAYCLIFDDPNAVLRRISNQGALGNHSLTLDLETGAIVPQESNHLFSRKFHAAFLRPKKNCATAPFGNGPSSAFKSTGLSYFREIWGQELLLPTSQASHSELEGRLPRRSEHRSRP